MDLLQYSFFQNALLGSLLASILCGLVGTYIVTRRLVFISGGLTHASFGGIGLGVFLGVNPIVSAMAFTMMSAFGVQWLSSRNEMREDSAIAIFWTLGMSIGVICSFLSPSFMPDLSSYLFGNILTITSMDIYILFFLTLMASVVFSFCFRPIMYVAFDREFARSQGISVVAIEYLLIGFIALTVVACLRMVGIVLVISLLTIPQSTANLLTLCYKKMMLYSIVIGYLSCLGGLLVSYFLNVPSGACIIFVSILFYSVCKIITLLLKK